MVGDTVWDVIAARPAVVLCIGLLSGGRAREPLRDAGAVEVYAGAAALLDKWAPAQSAAWPAISALISRSAVPHHGSGRPAAADHGWSACLPPSAF
jgi:hypothetical protein